MSDEFKKLLDNLNTMQKAMEPPAPKVDPEDEEEEEEEGAAAPLGKSFKVQVNGEEIEAVDGTKMLKSFRKKQRLMVKAQGAAVDLIKALIGANETLAKSLVEANENGAKSTQQVETLTKSLADLQGKFEVQDKAQGEMKKSLDAVANVGRGRRSATVTLPDAPADANGERKGIDPKTFMAKALTASEKGAVTGFEVARAETMLNKGLAPDEAFVRRVLDATGSATA